MKFSTFSLGLIVFVHLARPLTAAEPSLSLSQALDLAATRNPSLVALAFSPRAAEARIEQAGLRPNPTLDVTLENFAGTGTTRDIHRLETTVQASQLIERGDKRAKRVALAGHEHRIAEREYAVQQREVLAKVATAYAETLAAQQRLILAEEPLTLARETLTAADARVKAGAASAVESARARAAVASAQAEYVRAETSLAQARATLAANWDGNAAQATHLLGTISVPEALPSEEKFLAALEQHPRLDLQRAIIAGRRASLELEQAGAKQDFSVGGGVRFLREGSDAALVAGVSLPLPIRNKNQGNIRAARETLAGAEHSTRSVEAQLRVAFTAAWQELRAAHAAANNLRRDALPASTEAYNVVRQAYNEGQLPLIDVLDAQRALVAIHRELLEAETAYAVALTRVEALTAPTFPATSALLSIP